MRGALTEWDLRIAARQLVEEGRAIADHFEFERNGGKLFWIVDTDVAVFYLDPRHNARYADIFRHGVQHFKDETPQGLVALSAVLADFIFGERFHGAKKGRDEGDHSAGQKMLLEPHSEELHYVLTAIGRSAMQNARTAVEVLDGRLRDQVKALIAEYSTDKETSPTEFIARVQKIIGESLDLILPSGNLEKLKRGRDLLKSKRLVFEADCTGLHELLADEEATEAIDALADRWLNLIRELSPGQKLPESPPGLRRLGKGLLKRSEREGNLELREFRDAMVLAKLEYLNGRVTPSGAANERFVFISGHGFLRRVVREHKRFVRDAVGDVHILHPSVFLGSGDLFPLPTMEDNGGSDHWFRLTQVLVPLERPTPRTSKGEVDGPTTNASAELIKKVESEWADLLKFALPFLPAQSREASVRDIFKDLLTGKPLDALEQALYLALGELFVVTAELGLVPPRDIDSAPPLRKPPPLRLAYYPQAERCILAFVAPGRSDQPAIGELLERVKQEQEISGVEDFNYPLLVCLAERFASLDEWHAARVLANYASSVAKVTSHEAPLVTGREAALLECYCRRIDAKKLHDLDRAEAALNEFQEACERERQWWGDEKNLEQESERCKAQAFNPVIEFPLHQVRGESELATIRLTRLMFYLFSVEVNERELNVAIKTRAKTLHQLLVDAERIATDLGVLKDRFAGTNETITSILNFVDLQLAICIAQCLILLRTVEATPEKKLGGAISITKMIRILEASPTTVTRLLVLVLRCLWGGTKERSESGKVLCEMDFHPYLMPHDVERAKFFTSLAVRAAFHGSS